MAFKKVTPEEISHCLLNDASIRFDLSDDTVVAHPGFRGDPLTISFPRLLPLDKDGLPFVPGYSLVEQLSQENPLYQELAGEEGTSFIHAYPGRFAASNFEHTAPSKATHLLLTEQHNDRPPLHKGIDSAFGKAHGAVWHHYEGNEDDICIGMSFWILSEIPSCLTEYLQNLGEAERQC